MHQRYTFKRDLEQMLPLGELFQRSGWIPSVAAWRDFGVEIWMLSCMLKYLWDQEQMLRLPPTKRQQLLTNDAIEMTYTKYSGML